MTPVEFCIWLKGHFELTQANGEDIILSDEALDLVVKNLNGVDYPVVYTKEFKLDLFRNGNNNGGGGC